MLLGRWEEFRCLPLNELGDFLAGAFGPLALAWLVFGYFQQGDELRQGTEALKMQANELNASVQQQIQMVEAQKLALENHERSLEPILYLTYKGSDTDPDDGMEYDLFAVSNKGEYCDSLNLSYVRSTGEIFDIDLEPLHKDGEVRFSMELIYDDRTEITIRYKRRSGRSGSQKFELTRHFDEAGSFSRVRKITS